MEVYDYFHRPPKPIIDETIVRKSRVQQHFVETHNINKIVSRMQQRREVPLNERIAQYGDVSDIGTYADALIRVQNAQEQFDALPAKLKGMCNNNPVTFVEKMCNPDENWLKAGKEHGLYVEKDEVPVPKTGTPVPGGSINGGAEKDETGGQKNDNKPA